MSTQNAIGPSLLPYLDNWTKGVSIQIDHSMEPNSLLGDTHGNAGPISLLRKGRVVIDGHHSLKEVILITQSDYCTPARPALRPLTNTDLDSMWQQTWNQIKRRGGEKAPTVMPCQIDTSGTIAPLRPLFYCAHRDCYSHPLCPLCGKPLDLCRDDDLLNRVGLASYGDSLWRYLYCAQCHQSKAESYFYSKEANPHASEYVKDCDALIKSFHRLLKKSGLSDELACIECEQSAICYGSDMLALGRMRPFQFYPFHMFMQQAPTYGAIDFLGLVSGSQNPNFPVSENNGFLFKSDDRWFIEILHLKLTFLYELVLLIKNDPFFPVSDMTLDGIGVDMAVQGSALPYLWNFSLRLINPISSPGQRPTGSELSQTLANEFIGHAWFYVLLVNGKQAMVRINSNIDKQLAQDSELRTREKALYRHRAFDPGNIFWEPHTIDLSSDWKKLWVETLKMGMGLLRAGFGGGAELPLTVVETQLKELKKQAYQYLFEIPSEVKEQTGKSLDGDDARIATILSKILEQWPQFQGESDTGPPGSENPSPHEGKRNESRNDARRSQSPKKKGASRKPVSTQINMDTELEKTVVARHPVHQQNCSLGESPKNEECPPEPTSTQSDMDTEIEKTVLFRPRIHRSDDDFDEILLKSGSEEDVSSSEGASDSSLADPDLLDHSKSGGLEETVIVRIRKDKN